MSLRQLLAVGVATVVLATAGSALAGGQTFTDVPPSHPFVDDIEAIAAAGITTGYADGTYRPGATVTRGAMAAFMGRGFSSTSMGARPLGQQTAVTPNAEDPSQPGAAVEITSTEISSGATEAGNGWVTLSGTVVAYTAEDLCPCELSVFVDTPEAGTFARTLAVLDGDPTVNGFRAVTIPVDAIFDSLADETLAYTMSIQINTAFGPGTVLAYGNLVATYVPFVDDITITQAAASGAGAASEGSDTGAGTTRPSPEPGNDVLQAP